MLKKSKMIKKHLKNPSGLLWAKHSPYSKKSQKSLKLTCEKPSVEKPSLPRSLCPCGARRSVTAGWWQLAVAKGLGHLQPSSAFPCRFILPLCCPLPPSHCSALGLSAHTPLELVNAIWLSEELGFNVCAVIHMNFTKRLLYCGFIAFEEVQSLPHLPLMSHVHNGRFSPEGLLMLKKKSVDQRSYSALAESLLLFSIRSGLICHHHSLLPPCSLTPLQEKKQQMQQQNRWQCNKTLNLSPIPELSHAHFTEAGVEKTTKWPFLPFKGISNLVIAIGTLKKQERDKNYLKEVVCIFKNYCLNVPITTCQYEWHLLLLWEMKETLIDRLH